MKKIIVNDNQLVYVRRWFKWYAIVGFALLELKVERNKESKQ